MTTHMLPFDYFLLIAVSVPLCQTTAHHLLFVRFMVLQSAVRPLTTSRSSGSWCCSRRCDPSPSPVHQVHGVAVGGVTPHRLPFIRFMVLQSAVRPLTISRSSGSWRCSRWCDPSPSPVRQVHVAAVGGATPHHLPFVRFMVLQSAVRPLTISRSSGSWRSAVGGATPHHLPFVRFMALQSAVRPDWLELLCDSDTPPDASKKRQRKSLDRSLQLMDQCLALREKYQVRMAML